MLTLGIIMLFCTAVFAQTPNTFRDTTFELQFSGLSGGLMFDVGELPKTKIPTTPARLYLVALQTRGFCSSLQKRQVPHLSLKKLIELLNLK